MRSSPARSAPRPGGPRTRPRPDWGGRYCSRPRRARAGLTSGAHHPVSDEGQRDQDGCHPETSMNAWRRCQSGRDGRAARRGWSRRPARGPGRCGRTPRSAGGTRPRRPRRCRGCSPGLEVAAGRRVVIGLDAADNSGRIQVCSLTWATLRPARRRACARVSPMVTRHLPCPRAHGLQGARHSRGPCTIIAATPVSNRATGQYG